MIMRTIPMAGPISVAAFFSHKKRVHQEKVRHLCKEKWFVCHDTGVSVRKIQGLRQVSPPDVPC